MRKTHNNHAQFAAARLQTAERPWRGALNVCFHEIVMLLKV